MKRKLEDQNSGSESDELESVEVPPEENEISEPKLSKLLRDRERNKEHAKRTRQRKKNAMDIMKSRLLELHKEMTRLELLLEEKSTANILLHLNRSDQSTINSLSAISTTVSPPLRARDASEAQTENILSFCHGSVLDVLRQRVRIEATSWKHHPAYNAVLPYHDLMKPTDSARGAQALGADCLLVLAESPPHGISSAEDGAPTAAQPPSAEAKRARNRLHAQLTRERRKLFTLHMTQTIRYMEHQVLVLRGQLQGLVELTMSSSSSSSSSTSTSSPSPTSCIHETATT